MGGGGEQNQFKFVHPPKANIIHVRPSFHIAIFMVAHVLQLSAQVCKEESELQDIAVAAQSRTGKKNQTNDASKALAQCRKLAKNNDQAAVNVWKR